MGHTSRVKLSILITAVAVLLAACSSSGGSSKPAGSGAAGDPNDLLAKIKSAGVIKVGTDPAYPPQSQLKPDGSFEGFDIDVANEIGKRLGVKVKFDTPDFTVVEAGKWAGRFDISVGSVTVTEPRLKVLDFTKPYYFTPAQMTATTASGITTLEALPGRPSASAPGPPTSSGWGAPSSSGTARRSRRFPPAPSRRRSRPTRIAPCRRRAAGATSKAG